MTPVSPTFTGPLPKLEINLSICEIGDPCRVAIAGAPGSLPYVCRIHKIRRFFETIGWVGPPSAVKQFFGDVATQPVASKATTGDDPNKPK